MSREEAIEQLEFMLEQMPEEPPTECDYIDEWIDTNRKIRNAFDMAIKALGEPSVKDVLNKVRAEIISTLYVDSLIFGELLDFRDRKIDADDVIEKFNRITRLEVLRILDKCEAESEVTE